MIDDGILYSHWSDTNSLPWPWPNFDAHELSSRDSGEYYHHIISLTALQRTRRILGRAMFINSAHRSWLHNIAIGGAPRSAHLYIAFDVSTRNHRRYDLYKALRISGFKSFGFYESFIHCDMRPGRKWFGSHRAKVLWAPILAMRDQVDYELS